MSEKRKELTKMLHQAVLLLMVHGLISHEQAKAIKQEIDGRKSL